MRFKKIPQFNHFGFFRLGNHFPTLALSCDRNSGHRPTQGRTAQRRVTILRDTELALMGPLLPSPHRVHMGFTSLKTVLSRMEHSQRSVAVYPILKLGQHPDCGLNEFRDFLSTYVDKSILQFQYSMQRLTHLFFFWHRIFEPRTQIPSKLGVQPPL